MDLVFERDQLNFRLKAIDEERVSIVALMSALDLVIGEYMGGRSVTTPVQVLSSHVKTRKTGSAMQAIQAVMLQRGGKATLKELERKTGKTYLSVVSAMGRLQRKSYVIKEGRGQYRLVKVDRSEV